MGDSPAAAVEVEAVAVGELTHAKFLVLLYVRFLFATIDYELQNFTKILKEDFVLL